MVASSAGRVCIRRWFAAFRYTAAVLFKGAVHRKIKMTENVLTLRLSKIQMILFIYGNRFGEMYHSITCSQCSEWVPSEGESKQLIKHHNNPQEMHTTPVHQLISCELKSCMFVRNESITKTFLTSKRCFCLKYESSILHIAFLGREIYTDQALFTCKNNLKMHLCIQCIDYRI